MICGTFFDFPCFLLRGRFLIDFWSISSSKMRQLLTKIDPKIDTKSKLEFEGPVFEIFGDLGANLVRNQKCIQMLGSGRRSAGVQRRGGGS